MTPEQFLNQIRRQEPAPAYLFAGPEPYRRNLCRRALCDAVLGPEGFEQGYVAHDLAEAPLSDVLDDAASLSLFAPKRVLWIAAAEAALPRTRAAGSGEEPRASGPRAMLAAYLRRPSPGVVAVFDVSRYELEGEDKAKLDRVREFYAAIPNVVEFPRFSVGEARKLAGELAAERRLNLNREAVETLVDALGADAMRIASEIEKLSLYAGDGRTIGAEDLPALVPDSSVANIFALVDALGRRDRMQALEVVDRLVRHGEYLPLALNFLGSLVRLALCAQEKGLRSAQQIQQTLSRPGRPVWRSKAEQIHQTAKVFSKKQLEAAIGQIYRADWGLRDARPSDRVIIEKFILELAG